MATYDRRPGEMAALFGAAGSKLLELFPDQCLVAVELQSLLRPWTGSVTTSKVGGDEASNASPKRSLNKAKMLIYVLEREGRYHNILPLEDAGQLLKRELGRHGYFCGFACGWRR